MANTENLIFLEEGELAKLITLTQGTRNHVALAFGPGWCGLKWKESQWALNHLAEWRGIPVSGPTPFPERGEK